MISKHLDVVTKYLYCYVLARTAGRFKGLKGGRRNRRNERNVTFRAVGRSRKETNELDALRLISQVFPQRHPQHKRWEAQTRWIPLSGRCSADADSNIEHTLDEIAVVQRKWPSKLKLSCARRNKALHFAQIARQLQGRIFPGDLFAITRLD